MVKATLKERSEHFLKRAKDKFGDKFIYDKVDYVDSTTLISIFCTVHKDYFTVSPKDFLATRFNTCPKCKFDFDSVKWDRKNTLDNVSYSGKTGYPGSTEVFNGSEWIPLSEVTKSTLVTVFDPSNEKVTLEYPLKVIKTNKVRLVTYSNIDNRPNKSKGYNITLGYHSKFLLTQTSNYLTTYLWYQLRKNLKNAFVNTFKVYDKPLNISDDAFKLLIHIYLTDSKLFHLNGSKVNIKITKYRTHEIERLTHLLDINNVSYTIKKIQPSRLHKTRTVFMVNGFNRLRNIDIPVDWYSLSTYYKNIIINELYTYCHVIDKSGKRKDEHRKYFKCKTKKVFDFIQYTLHSSGIFANFYYAEDPVTRVKHYYISRTLVSNKIAFKSEITSEYIGTAFSLKTKSGFVLFRQNNNIFIGADGYYEIK